MICIFQENEYTKCVYNSIHLFLLKTRLFPLAIDDKINYRDNRKQERNDQSPIGGCPLHLSRFSYGANFISMAKNECKSIFLAKYKYKY